MRVVFMGSPSFGLPTLDALMSTGHDLALVVSQPDRRAGRARRLRASAVAAFARDRGLPLYQPEQLRDQAALLPIRQADPELIVVAAFGLLLPQDLLDLPQLGCLNVHPSLLPLYRGASPVQAALLAGDEETGVTIIRLTEKMDAGPILAQIPVPIGADEDAPTLEARLAEAGAKLLVECLGPWASGELVARPQNEAHASYCKRLDRSDAELDWSLPAALLVRKVRAFRGRTDAFTHWQGRLIRVLSAEAAPPIPGCREPGTVCPIPRSVRARGPTVATGADALLLRQLAVAGRPPTSGQAFLNGYPSFIGSQLGKPERS